VPDFKISNTLNFLMMKTETSELRALLVLNTMGGFNAAGCAQAAMLLTHIQKVPSSYFCQDTKYPDKGLS
jgi:hypothetical protein